MINKYHILPINDLEEHEKDGVVCKCRPEIRIEDEYNWLIVHNSFDGREWKELADKRNYEQN